MKYIDKKLNEQIQVNKELTFIEKNGEEVLCYCKMRNTNCFETYQYDCPNYRELTKEESK